MTGVAADLPLYVITSAVCLACGSLQRQAQPLAILGRPCECGACHEMAMVPDGPAYLLPYYKELIDSIVQDHLRMLDQTLLTAAGQTSTIEH